MKKKILFGASVCMFLVLSVSLVNFLTRYIPQINNDRIRDEVGSKVVMITGAMGGGTGFHVNLPSGKVGILTNSHVCELGKEGFVNVTLNNHSRAVPRRIIESYGRHDLCLVEGLEGVGGINLASEVRVGEVLNLVGYPRLTPLTISTGEYIGQTVIQLYEMSRGGLRVAMPLADESAANMSFSVKTYRAGHITNIAYPGNSGSPVVNAAGELTGVLFAGNMYIITLGYVVPLDVVSEFISVH